MNHKVTSRQKLLDSEGMLTEPGWANQLIFDYSPFDVKANKMRIKEWDYYIIIDKDFAFSTLISDNRYMGLANACLYDFVNAKKYVSITPLVMPNGKLNLPADSSKGDIYFKSMTSQLAYIHEKDHRRLTGKFKTCDIEFDIRLEKFLDDDTMVIATPWKDDKKAFYYNQKINCMPASGYVRFNGKTYNFSPDTHFATLDWGRGVWTYDNTWHWGSGNGIVNGKRFGFNIGYGFGDTTAASENMIFYDGKCHKFDRLRFEIPESILQPWKFITNDGRFDMDFYPIYENKTNIDAVIFSQHANQVFGRLNGKAILDDGTKLEIKDLVCFAEKVHNKY